MPTEETDPTKSELFGDLVAPIIAQYNNPVYMAKAYQQYVASLSTPVVTHHDKLTGQPVFGKADVEIATPEEFMKTGMYQRYLPFSADSIKDTLKKEWGTEIGLTSKIPFIGYVFKGKENESIQEVIARLKSDGTPYSLPKEEQSGVTGGEFKPVYSRQKDEETILNYQYDLMKPQTMGTEIASGASQLPTFMAEFYATGGLKAIGSAAGKTLGAAALGKYAQTKAGQLTLKLMGWSSGVLSQSTVGFAPMTYENFQLRETLQALGIKDEEPTAISILKAYGDTLIEVGSESAGEGITAGTGALIGKLPFGSKIVGALETGWIKATGGTKGEFWRKLASQGGYSNILGELGEEYLGDALRAVTGVDDFGAGKDANPFQRLQKAIEQDIKQTPVMLGILALPMLPGVLKSVHGVITKETKETSEGPITQDKFELPQEQLQAILDNKGPGTIATPEDLMAHTETAETLTSQVVMGDTEAFNAIQELVSGSPELLPLYTKALNTLKESGSVEAGEALDKLISTAKPAETTEQEIQDKAYIKGFAARLTVISNTADKMVVGAGKPAQQKQVLQDEINSITDSYQKIDDLIQQNPEALKELGEIKGLLPGYKQAVDTFIKTPSKEGFKTIRAIGKQIATLGNQYADRVSRQTIETVQITEEQKAEYQASEDAVVSKIVSRFPAKVKDTQSLETVGNLIAKDVGVGETIKWEFVHNPKIEGASGLQWQDENGVQHIRITQGTGVSGKVKSSLTNAGFPIGKSVGPTQAALKRAIVHELGHIAVPAIRAGKVRKVHHQEFADWVNTKVDRLWGVQEGDVVTPGRQKVANMSLPSSKDNVADAISGGQEVAPDGTVHAPVTEEEAIAAFHKMLEQGGEATKARVDEVRLLRAKQYAIVSSILDKAGGSEKYRKALGSLKDIKADMLFNWANPISDAVYEKLCSIIDSKFTSSWNRIDCWKALTALRAGEGVTYSQKLLLSKAFGLTPEKISSGKIEWTLSKALYELWNAPRLMLCGFWDNSTLLRQMFYGAGTHPIEWGKAAYRSTRGMFQPKWAEQTLADIYQRANFEYYQKMNLDITSVTGSIETTNEANIGGLIMRYRPPTKGEGAVKRTFRVLRNVASYPFRAAMRAADIAGNTFRVNVADLYINANKGLIDAREDANKQWQYLGNNINEMTGRIHVKHDTVFKKVSAILNPFAFSLQLHTSRIVFLTTGVHATGERLLSMVTGGKFDGKYSPEVRKAISNSFLKFATLQVAMIALASYLWPDKCSNDPETSSYGKIKIGNTYYDLTQGLGQYVRFVAQMISGKKRSVTGNRYNVGRASILESFVRSKAAPTVNMVWDAIAGKKMTGEPVDWTTKEGVLSNMWNYFSPMIMQDIVDVYKNNPHQVIPATVLSFYGSGLQSYALQPSQQAVIMKKKLAVETFGKDWDELGPSLQKALYKIHPELEQIDREVKATRTDWNSIGLRMQESQMAGKEVLHQLPQSTQTEIIRLNLTLGGFGRQIGSSTYFLNEDRFNQYQALSGKLLDAILPKIIESTQYNLLDEEVKYKLINALINKCKSTARQTILNSTTREDMVTLESLKQRRMAQD